MLRLMAVRGVAVPVAVALVLVGCGTAPGPGNDAAGQPAPEATSAGAGGWSTAAPAPLAPRHSAHVVAVGDEVVVFGGNASAVCPPAASCADRPQYLSDGATYSPKADTWRPIATSPVSPTPGSVAEHEGLVYLLTEQHLHAYDVRTDTWTELPVPPDTSGRLISAGRHLLRLEYTQEGGQVRADHLYEPTTRTWRTLPRDPLAPAFDRGAVWAGDRVVLLGKPEPPPPVDGVDSPPVFMHAATFDVETWEWTPVRQRDEVIGFGTEYFWTGDRVLLPYTFDYTQGGLNPGGAAEPTGGLLDPDTGDWERLPRPPAQPTTPLRVQAGSPAAVTAGEGLVLDLANDRWFTLEPAPGAPTEGVAAAWSDRQLVAFGGAATSDGTRMPGNDTRIWTLPN